MKTVIAGLLFGVKVTELARRHAAGDEVGVRAAHHRNACRVELARAHHVDRRGIAAPHIPFRAAAQDRRPVPERLYPGAGSRAP